VVFKLLLEKLFFSLGHRPVAVINSQTFDYDNESQLWRERRCINLGLLLGKQRSTLGGEDRQVPYEMLGSLHRELFRNCPKDIWPDISARFIYYNSDTLKQFPNIPWVAPEYLGGPGLVPKNGEMLFHDRAVLSYLIRKQNTKDKRLKIKKIMTLTEWQLHKIVTERISQIDVLPMNYQQIRENNGILQHEEMENHFPFYEEFSSQNVDMNYSKMYKQFVVETLFRDDITALYKPKNKSKVKRNKREDYMTNNKSHWKNNSAYAEARKQIEFYGIGDLKVRSTEDLTYEKKFSCIPVLELAQQ